MKHLVILACCCLAISARADPCQTTTSKREINRCFETARGCGKAEDSSERLVCYDQIFKSTEQPPSTDDRKPVSRQQAAELPQSTQIAVEDNVIVQQQQNEDFPLSTEIAKKSMEKPLQMQAKIVRLQASPRGMMVITLDNSQVWRENAASTLQYRIGSTVTIKHGVFGSNNLVLEGSNRKVKVKRIE
jgi:hypothetical protein